MDPRTNLKSRARYLPVTHGRVNITDKEKTASDVHRQVHLAANGDQIAVEIAAMAPDKRGALGFSRRRRRNDANHGSNGETVRAELEHAIDDRTDARHRALDHV